MSLHFGASAGRPQAREPAARGEMIFAQALRQFLLICMFERLLTQDTIHLEARERAVTTPNIPPRRRMAGKRKYRIETTAGQINLVPSRGVQKWRKMEPM